MTTSGEIQSSLCWLCEGLGGVAKHLKASAQFGKPLFVAHRPKSRSHPVMPCPACTTKASQR